MGNLINYYHKRIVMTELTKQFLNWIREHGDYRTDYRVLSQYTKFIEMRSLQINQDSLNQFISFDKSDILDIATLKRCVKHVTGIEVLNGNNISDPGGDLIPVLDSEKMESRGEVAVKKLWEHGGQVLDNKANLIAPAVSNIHASDNLTLSEIEEQNENKQIFDDVVELANNTRARTTIDGYRKDFRLFVKFCTRKNFDYLPASEETVIAYITWMHKDYKLNTIERHLSAIRYFHKKQNLLSPITDKVKDIRDAIKRKIGDHSESKKPLLASHIQKICSCLSPTDLIDIRDKALLLINFSGCFRRSELVSLNVENIKFIEDKGITIDLKKSKTDQFGKGIVKVIPYGENKLTCPVLALCKWLEMSEIYNGAIFRGFDINGNLKNDRLDARSVANIIKRLVKLIGLNPFEYSGHSTRSGAATQAGLNHSSLKQIMALGDWKSANTAIRYQKSINKFEEKANLGL